MPRFLELSLLSIAAVGLAACAPMRGTGFQASAHEADPTEAFEPRTPSRPLSPPAEPASAPMTAPKTGLPAPIASVPEPSRKGPGSEATSPLTAGHLPIPAWAHQAQGDLWTRITHRAIQELGQALLQTEIQDAQDFCPTYSHLALPGRELVWLQLISSVVKFESGFKPWEAFAENFKGRNGQPVISRGLMQISIGSANDYGCSIKTETELENPEINLRCGIHILAMLVSKYHAIHGLQERAETDPKNPWRGAARYWSVLRSKAKDFLIRASVRQLPVCQML